MRELGSVPPAGSHGGDGLSVAAALGLDPAGVLDLSMSLNPLAPDLTPMLRLHAGAIRHYPDPEAATLALSSAMGVDHRCLVLTNGGAEAIALVARMSPRIRVHPPEFSLYERHAGALHRDGVLWRSNPNNPTGRLASACDCAGVWDEAFYPLATGRWTRGDHERGSWVVGSLTKLFACPGLRMGYVLAPDHGGADAIRKRQPAWALNSLAAEMLPELVGLVDLAGWSSRIASLREELCSVLALYGLVADPSDACYVLVRDAGWLRQSLAREGVVVRDTASFGIPGGVRIAVPDGGGLERVAEALRRVSGQRIRGAWITPRRRAPTDITTDIKGLRGALMVCGTGSDVGKSQLVSGLCRMLSARGVRVAPFKAQNMALNSYVTPAGDEIGRAQAMQAMAAGIDPEAAMNPILLKPMGDARSQVVLMGKPWADLDAASYQAVKPELFDTVCRCLADLRSRFDVVIVEGAGSPAEINLLAGDLVNLSLADKMQIPAILVADIDRGGAFAAVYGTIALLEWRLARWIRGFVLNKFRGDASLLGDAPREIERRTGVGSLGVIPFLPGIVIGAEDSQAMARSQAMDSALPGAGDGGESRAGFLDVAVIRLPLVANFTDFDPLVAETSVHVRYVSAPSQLGDPDLVVIPGSKATVRDMEWLVAQGFPAALRSLACRPGGSVLLGICAGYQMLGEAICDPIESGRLQATALGWLPVRWRMDPSKITRRREGYAFGEVVHGYEIHHGRPSMGAGVPDGGPAGQVRAPLDIRGSLEGVELVPFATLNESPGFRPEGLTTRWWDPTIDEPTRAAIPAVSATSLHGCFEADGFRRAFIGAVSSRRGRPIATDAQPFSQRIEEQLDRLAVAIEAHLDVERLMALVAEGEREWA